MRSNWPYTGREYAVRVNLRSGDGRRPRVVLRVWAYSGISAEANARRLVRGMYAHDKALCSAPMEIAWYPLKEGE